MYLFFLFTSLKMEMNDIEIIMLYISYFQFCVIHCSLFRVSVKRNYNLPSFSFLKLYFFFIFEKREKRKMIVPISLPEKEGNWDNEMKREKTQKTKKKRNWKKDNSILLSLCSHYFVLIINGHF